MGKFVDLTGQRFGRWTVLGRGEDLIRKNGYAKIRWLCQCSCDKHTVRSVETNLLNSGGSKSCGCIKDEKLAATGKNRAKYNKYEFHEDYGVGFTSNSNLLFYFDLEDYDKIREHCWYESNGYAWTCIRGTKNSLKLHRLITNAPRNQVVDHINHNPLDNRKINLRICSQAENMKNIKTRKNSSGCNGVCWDKARKKWSARIVVDGKNKYLGCFVEKEDAIKARLEAEEKYYGEFALRRELLSED